MIFEFNINEEKCHEKIKELEKEISILKDNKNDVKKNEEESKNLSESEKIKKNRRRNPNIRL